MYKSNIDRFVETDYYSAKETLFPSDMNISGGKMTFQDIDRLSEFPNIKSIRISGLNQSTFEYFIDNYAAQFEIIYFWKNPLISDLSKLSQLNKLKYVLFFWNQRATKLWDMSTNHNLKGIVLDDFSRLHCLDELITAPFLEEFHFGDLVWDGFVIETLEPLQHCTNLVYLNFSAKKIINNDLTPLSKLSHLIELLFPSNLFSTEQIAWLTSKLPNLKSDSLAPFRMISPIEWKTKTSIKHKDTIIIGKGKPFLDSKADAIRIKKYTDAFYALVKYYAENPNSPCPTLA